jgi:hypothetical protein
VVPLDRADRGGSNGGSLNVAVAKLTELSMVEREGVNDTKKCVAVAMGRDTWFIRASGSGWVAVGGTVG